MPMIRETIVTTVDRAGAVHIAPLGLIADGDHWIIAPFRPSRTLDNLREVPHAVASHVDDVRIFAGCLTGRRDWPTVATGGPGAAARGRARALGARGRERRGGRAAAALPHAARARGLACAVLAASTARRPR